MKTEWRDILNYEGLYQVSNHGEVKSFYIRKTGKILKYGVGVVYYNVALHKDGRQKSFQVHQLVAIAFLNHTPCGYKLVVDHIDNNPLNNKLNNLQIITHRENLSKDRTGSSKYTGVTWAKERSRWLAAMYINGKSKNLGYYKDEHEAHLAYQNKLNEITI